MAARWQNFVGWVSLSPVGVERQYRLMDFAHIPPEAPVLTGDEPLVGLVGVTVRDFWSWGMSDLRTNTLRGVLAEFIVSRAVGSLSVRRVEWDAFDVLTPEGVRVEVKAAAYLQGWSQPRLTDIRFSGLSARLLDEAANTYAGDRDYNADVYCFCVQTATSHDTLDVLDGHPSKVAWISSTGRPRALDRPCAVRLLRSVSAR